jgi:predicted metalloprotease with PDZ domain
VAGASPVSYLVDLSAREQHLVTVRMDVPADATGAGGRLVIATWTPGSYVVRDYVHHLQQLHVRDATGAPVRCTTDGISAWLLPAVEGPLTIELEWYAYDLSVRTNHVDDHHALLVGAATFPCFEPTRGRQHHVHLTGYASEHTVVALLPGEGDGPYVAEDHDHLVDAAFEVAPVRSSSVDVHGVEHRVVWAGHGAGSDVRGLADDLGRIAHAAVELFDGDLPTPRYTVLAVDGDGGGLEHRDGCVVAFPPHASTDPDRRRRIQGLLAHEYLHLWNVRRLVPADLRTPPLDRPVVTASLWVAEGWTSYYDRLLPARCGLWGVAELLTGLDRLRHAVAQLPGAELQSLHDASRTAWTKHYRRDENSPNAGTDYYAHGALAAFALDLLLRRQGVPDGLDTVLRDLWRRHGAASDTGTARSAPGGAATARAAEGYTEDDVVAAFDRAGGAVAAQRCIDLTTRPGRPEVEDDLAVLGLRLLVGDAGAPELGVLTSTEGDRIVLTHVLRDGPAWRAGISGGDHLLALDSETLTPAELPTVLRRYGAGAHVRCLLRRGPRVLERTVELAAPSTPTRLAPDPVADEAARARFQRWSGLPFPG